MGRGHPRLREEDVAIMLAMGEAGDEAFLEICGGRELLGVEGVVFQSTLSVSVELDAYLLV